MEKAKVYFTKTITPEKVVEMYKVLGKELKGKIAVKVHSGEKGNQNYLHPEFMKPIIDYVKGTIVECNTAYEGMRDTTEKHEKLMKEHGWDTYFHVDIMDRDGEITLPISKGKILSQNYVGKNIQNYDAMLVLSHFKGHPMGGYGGALKQLSIGVASSRGKRYIHCIGKDGSYEDMFQVDQIKFLEAMADSASSVSKYFDGNIAYINVMCNLSVDCDCCAVAEDPCMKDIGILSSLDPIALDKACLDLIYKSEDKGKDHFIKRVEEKHGMHIIDTAIDLGFGTKEYELIDIDKK